MMENSSAQQLKALLERLSGGEDLASVRKDFVKEFQSVPVQEIMKAEQELIRDGADPKKVTKLCDLHSALFHGKTEGEVIREEKRMKKQDLLKLPQGHPVDYFIREDSALELLLNNFQMALENGGHDDKVRDGLLRLKKIRALYGKKEELIMAPLERYGITGPSQVMWGVDDEIKAEVSRLSRGAARTKAEELKEPILAVIKRIREMIYKDENILLPIAMQKLTDSEWVGIYRDIHEMGPVFIDRIPVWEHGEQALKTNGEVSGKADTYGIPENDTASERCEGPVQKETADKETQRRTTDQESGGASAGTVSRNAGTVSAALDPDRVYVRFSGNGSDRPAGELTLAQLKGILSVLPVDVTFIDNQTVNRFYKNTDKVFSRPLSTLGQSTYQCHPVPIRAVVKSLTDDFRSGARDSFTRWIPNPDRPVRVTYLAVRDDQGRYLGAAEIIQDMTDAFRHFKSMEAAETRAAAAAEQQEKNGKTAGIQEEISSGQETPAGA